MTPAPDRPAWPGICRASGRGLLVALPLAIMASRAVSDALIAVIGLLFLVTSAAGRDWSWLRAPWVAAVAAWWAWMILCSALMLGLGGAHPLVQAVLMARFFLLAAAAAAWLGQSPAWRRAAIATLGLAAAWIALECWQQYLLGTNLVGAHRWMDGALTGPFRTPRAGPELVLILFPALLPPVAALLAGKRRGRIAGGALFVLAVATMVLIGQRMPALLTGLGVLLCGLILRPLRRVALAAAVLGLLVVAATPVVSPPTFRKLVVHFSQQMRHFPRSDYGQLYIRATVMGLDHPLTGLGFDGFRAHCHDPAYRHGLPALGIPDAAAESPAACNIHPHNHYLEAFTAGGWPGLLLFCIAVGFLLAAIARGVTRGGAAQAGCLIGAVLAFWPLASTSALFTLPNAGWIFLVVGIGLAEAAAARS